MPVNCIALSIQISLSSLLRRSSVETFGRHPGSYRVRLAVKQRYCFCLRKPNAPEKCCRICQDLSYEDLSYEDLFYEHPFYLFLPRCWPCRSRPLGLPPIRSTCEFSPSTISTATFALLRAESESSIPPTRPGKSWWKPAAPSIWRRWSSNCARATRTASLSLPAI